MMAKIANPNVASPATGIGAPGEREPRGRRAAHRRRVRAYVGLGANLGDAATTLAAGIRALTALPGVRLRAVSRLYATAPWGKADQPEFRNAVVALAVPAGPDDRTAAVALLTTLKSIERVFGREERERWGPRELDLDLLVFGRAHFSTQRPAAARSRDPAKAGPQLTVPHPEARHRLFVLAPLADVAPRLAPPGWGETVDSARRRQLQAEGPEAVRPIARWQRGAWQQLDGESSA